jgi:hypothetical protein
VERLQLNQPRYPSAGKWFVWAAAAKGAAIEVRAETHVIGANEFDGVVDVLDDSFPGNVWQFAFSGGLFLLLGPRGGRSCQLNPSLHRW